MLKPILLRINKDLVFQAAQMKTPLKVMLSEGNIFKTFPSVGSAAVGVTEVYSKTSTVLQ